MKPPAPNARNTTLLSELVTITVTGRLHCAVRREALIGTRWTILVSPLDTGALLACYLWAIGFLSLPCGSWAHSPGSVMSDHTRTTKEKKVISFSGAIRKCNLIPLYFIHISKYLSSFPPRSKLYLVQGRSRSMRTLIHPDHDRDRREIVQNHCTTCMVSDTDSLQLQERDRK